MRFAEVKNKLSVAPDGNEGGAVMVMQDGSRMLCWEDTTGKIQTVAFDNVNGKLIVNVDGTPGDMVVDGASGTLTCHWKDKTGAEHKKTWRNFFPPDQKANGGANGETIAHKGGEA